MSNIGKNIRKIRTSKGLSQSAFAELFGLTRASIGAYEEGRAEPKLDAIVQIAKYFSFTLDKILMDEVTVNEIHQFELPSDQVEVKNELAHDAKVSAVEGDVPVALSTEMRVLKSKDWSTLSTIQLNKAVWNIDLMVQLCPDIKRNEQYWMDGSWLMLRKSSFHMLMDNLDYLVLRENELFILKGGMIPDGKLLIWEISWVINSLSNYKHLVNDSRLQSFESRLSILENKL